MRSDVESRPPMNDRRPWDRLRSALHLEGSDEGPRPRPLEGVSDEGLRSWSAGRGLTVHEPAEGPIVATGSHPPLGWVEARWLVTRDGVLVLEVSARSDRPSPIPDLAAFLLEPLTRGLREPERSAIDTWTRGQLGHRGPYNAATTLESLQLAVAIEDGEGPGRTWTVSARARPG